MNKRKTIYKGFNKRRKNRMIKVYVIGVGIFILFTYGCVQLKNINMFNNIKEKVASIEFKLPFIDSNKSNESELETFNYEDVAKEIEKNNETKVDEVNEDVKVAKVKGWNVYTIQVASVEDKNEIIKVEETLTKEKVPFSTLEIDGVNKVQTYVSFDKESIRGNLDNIRKLFNTDFKLNNKQRIKSTLNLVNEAVNDAANTVANYQDSHDR